jgi:hypothetical protein
MSRVALVKTTERSRGVAASRIIRIDYFPKETNDYLITGLRGTTVIL